MAIVAAIAFRVHGKLVERSVLSKLYMWRESWIFGARRPKPSAKDPLSARAFASDAFANGLGSSFSLLIDNEVYRKLSHRRDGSRIRRGKTDRNGPVGALRLRRDLC